MKTDFILDEIRKNAELGEIKKVIKLSKKLERKTKNKSCLYDREVHNYSKPFGMAEVEDKEPKVNFHGLSTLEFNKRSNDLIDWITNPKTPIAPPLGFSHDFHKGMLEAEKELDKVCKQNQCSHQHVKIDNWYETSLTDQIVKTTKVCLECGKNLTIDKRTEMKNRQIEIGKEIEFLRMEARTIKNALKD